MSTKTADSVNLAKFAWLSIVAALATISLKTGAWLITGSVGLFSDATESLVNLVAAIIALIVLKISALPPDWNHNYGHNKAEYFSSGLEGLMIFIAASVIMVSSWQRFWHPRPIDNISVGLVISIIASLINGGVAFTLLKVGRKHRSIILIADGKHLLTDVWTSLGVIAGIILVPLTGWERLDPIIAFCVAINILITGAQLIGRSTAGLMDASLPKEVNETIQKFLASRTSDEITFHAIRTRESGTRRFMDVHMLVPGNWSVQFAHTMAEDMIDDLHELLPEIHVHVHLEPIEDPRSYEDIDL